MTSASIATVRELRLYSVTKSTLTVFSTVARFAQFIGLREGGFMLAEPLADVETMASNARGHASAAENRRVREVDPFAAH